MSIFANIVPLPRTRTMATASSTDAYLKEQKSLGMPSLTLLSIGAERSTIRRNLFGWWGLGTRPIGLVCTSGRWAGAMGPSKRPADNSAAILSVTTSGLARQDG